MALVDSKDLLTHAYKNRYAVGAFEVVSLDFLRAIVEAAERARSPVILNIVETHASLYDVDLLMGAVLQAAKRASVPIAIHLDHCTSIENIQAGIRLGCNSVMFDAADESFPVNTKKTQQVVELAHSCGIPVEGEIGYVAGNGTEPAGDSKETSTYTSVNEAKAYVERTGVDFLAISVGTVHGRGKGKPKLDFTRLARINEALCIPLVIHGGTGLSEDQYQKLIANGVARINYFTGLADTAVKTLHDNFGQDLPSYRKLMGNVSDRLAAEALGLMQVWGSAGRAAEVLMQCREWHPVDEIILFKPSGNEDPEVIDYILEKTKSELESIPGVKGIEFGRSDTPQGHFQFYLRVRLASGQAAENYKKHPAYRNYLDKYARYIESNAASGTFQLTSPSAISQGVAFLAEQKTSTPSIIKFKTP